MHRFSWFSGSGGSVGLVLLVGSAGCGLVLDAGARTDASVSDDARGMDAPLERVDAPLTELDAPHDLDAFEPFEPIDAFVEDAADPASEPDTLLSPLDAFFSTSDAFAADVAVSPSSDGGLDGGGRADAGRDAAVDASLCPAACPPMATAMGCRATTCSADRCVPVGGLLVCPPAGTCEQTCGGPTGSLACGWRGTSCSPPLGACSTDANCTAGGHCAEVGACLHRVCLPSCPTEGAACTFVVEGTAYTGTCDSGNTCRPMSIACD